jgi:predicted aspartyl protease
MLAVGSGLVISQRSLAGAVSLPTPSWDFGATHLEWEALEIETGDTPLVSAEVRGFRVRALLDSGSGATIISTALAAKLGIENGERRIIGGLSAEAPVQLVRNVDVLLARETRRLPFAVVVDLGAASAAFGRPIDVILGTDMFTESCIALDFGNRRLAVAKSGTFMAGTGWRAVALGHGTKQELVIRASVAGRAPVPLMIDLGSDTALMLSSAYSRDQGLLTQKLVSSAAIIGVDGLKTNDAFTVSTISIEGFRVANIPSLGMREWLPGSTVGDIGLPLIAQFDVVFDVTAGVVWFRPLDPRHRLPMLKDRSGLASAVSPTALTVVHVAAHSPAEKDGWVIGDRIVTVNGHPVDANYTHGELWRWRFGSVGTLVRLTMATGEVRELKLADYY